MTEIVSDQLEMRKLEQLSNTIFGVAMTLLAYDLPKAALFDHLPDWSDLYHVFGGRLAGMALSFIIAGVFWISHQRRLTRQPMGSRGVVMLNLLFLLSIIVLPVTNGLYGNYGMSGAVAVLYGLNLTAIAGLNALLSAARTRARLSSRGARGIVSAAAVHSRHDRGRDRAAVCDVFLAARLFWSRDTQAHKSARRDVTHASGRDAPGMKRLISRISYTAPRLSRCSSRAASTAATSFAQSSR